MALSTLNMACYFLSHAAYVLFHAVYILFHAAYILFHTAHVRGEKDEEWIEMLSGSYAKLSHFSRVRLCATP